MFDVCVLQRRHGISTSSVRPSREATHICKEHKAKHRAVL